jgi:lysyl-tRNA synthetase class II
MMMHEYAQNCILKNDIKEELKDNLEEHINDYINDKMNNLYIHSLPDTIIYYSISCIMLGGSIYFIYWLNKTFKSIFCIIEQQQNQSQIMLSIQNELVDKYTYCKKYGDQYNIEINNIFKHLNNLENKFYRTYKSVDQSNIDINNLMKRLNDIESKYSLIERYINFDDKYKQILIGFHRNIGSNLPKFDQSIFCPKYTTNLDKYIGNNGIVFFLPCLAQ